jgi:hypothetical protein
MNREPIVMYQTNYSKRLHNRVITWVGFTTFNIESMAVAKWKIYLKPINYKGGVPVQHFDKIYPK